MLLMLILQGMALAAADVLPADQAQPMEHCAGHDEAGADCACCSGSDMMGVNCASQCSAAASISVSPFTVSPQIGAQVFMDVGAWTAGPAYSPLNPPPIA